LLETGKISGILLFFWDQMKLTQRQEDFIGNLIELYMDFQGPIHYSTVAERLGVSNITAYDMLRLLEDKGLAVSQYELADGKSGPGRSKILFAPSPRAHQMMAAIIGDGLEPDSPDLKNRIFEKIRLGDLEEPEVTQEILEHLPPEDEGSIRFCTELITIFTSRIQHIAGKGPFLAHLSKILTSENAASKSNLGIIGGFALGMLMNERAMDDEWANVLVDHVQRYQSCVSEMNHDERQRLAKSLLDTLKRFNAVQIGK